VIACLVTVTVPPAWRERYIDWIAQGRTVRESHGILAELVLEPESPESGDVVVLTLWPSHEVFDAWIATPERDRLTASEVHNAVDYRPITRYEISAGYLNLPGLGHHDPSPPRGEEQSP
jgi:heme-degrading monooxygenase HmoA